MYKNLNDLASTNLSVSYSNTSFLTNVDRQLGANITFKYQQLKDNTLKVIDRVIKNCVIFCPNGQVWTSLNYMVHYSQYDGDQTYTLFDFSYVLQDQWDENGDYVIYVGAADNSASLSNAPNPYNQQGTEIASNTLLAFQNGGYKIKRLVAGDGINISTYYDLNEQKENSNILIISAAPHNYLNEQIISLQQGDVNINVINGNIQILKSQYNSNIVDVNYKYNENLQVMSVTLMVYKPYKTTLTFGESVLLMQYDVGWFSFTVKKCNGFLFFSQPTRMITNYKIENET